MKDQHAFQLNSRYLVHHRKKFGAEKSASQASVESYSKLLWIDFFSNISFLGESEKQELLTEFLAAELPDSLKEQIKKLDEERLYSRDYDFVFFCVKPVELEALSEAFNFDLKQSKPDRDLKGVSLYFCELQLDNFPVQKILVAYTDIDTNLQNASKMSHVLQLVDTSKAFLIGMCAGVKKRMNIGHVAISRKVKYYESGKYTGRDLEPRDLNISLNQNIYMTEILENLQEEYVNSLKQVSSVNHKFSEKYLDDGYQLITKEGVAASGEKLVASEEFMEGIAARDQQCKYVDMESAAFALTCNEFSVPWLIFKGISDYGLESDRGDESVLEPELGKYREQFSATFSAAVALKCYIKNCLVAEAYRYS